MENYEIQEPQSNKKHSHGKKKENAFLSSLRDIVFLVAGVLLAFSVLFRVVIVSGPSMNDTLVHGDWLLLLGNVFYSEPEQGDIVVASKKASGK